MASKGLPRVSIGVPVYNGERYLREALASILSQTFDDLEVVISDNASTDGTASICHEFAARDRRVSYVRQPVNMGAAFNFNEVFRLSRGQYFKWAAADDVLANDYLARCVEILDSEPDAVLCQAATVDIDEEGHVLRHWTNQRSGGEKTPHERLRRLLAQRHECFPVFGLIRTLALKRTGLIGAYTESDDVLVAELALHGRFAEIDAPLFKHREHVDRSVTTHPRSRDRTEWFDPRRAGKTVFPAWRLLHEYIKMVWRAPLSPSERLRCYAQIRVWVSMNWESMLRNVAWVMKQRAGSQGMLRKGSHATAE